MPTRSRRPASGASRKAARAPAGSSKGTKPAKPAKPRPAARAAEVTTGAGAPPPAPARPRVQRTCYEVRLMVCPRNPATCPDTWPLGQKVLCGSTQMLARFEKAGGADDPDATEAGLADALTGLSIRNRPDADPDEVESDGDEPGTEEDEG